MDTSAVNGLLFRAGCGLVPDVLGRTFTFQTDEPIAGNEQPFWYASTVVSISAGTVSQNEPEGAAMRLHADGLRYGDYVVTSIALFETPGGEITWCLETLGPVHTGWDSPTYEYYPGTLTFI